MFEIGSKYVFACVYLCVRQIRFIGIKGKEEIPSVIDSMMHSIYIVHAMALLNSNLSEFMTMRIETNVTSMFNLAFLMRFIKYKWIAMRIRNHWNFFSLIGKRNHSNSLKFQSKFRCILTTTQIWCCCDM